MKKFLPFFIVFIVALAFSCKKDKEKNVQGRWELVTKPYFGPNLAYEQRYFWEIREGKIYVTYTDTNEVLIDSCATGTYEIKNSVLSVIAPIEFCGESTYDGEWEIQKLDSKFMTLLRYLPRGTIWLEFAKRGE